MRRRAIRRRRRLFSMKSNFINKISNFFVSYFSLSGQLVSQSEAEQNIREGVSFRGTSILILILAIFIASLGLNTNSTAVIIGAMLISPLMGPIIGIGLGVGIHDFELIKRCVRNLLMASAFSVLASTIYFLISPVNESHSELLARTSPTIYDVLIGFVGGGAGIIALGSTNKGNVIPGVAIATALMPPLCTAGYGLATWQLNYFFGASYLFVINSIYIAFATFIGVKLMKYKGSEEVNNVRARKIRRIVYTLAVLTMLPSVYLTYRMFQQNNFQRHVSDFISSECRFPDTQVISSKAFVDHGERHLQLTLIGRALPVDSLKLALGSRLKFYGLEGTKLSIFQGSDTYNDRKIKAQDFTDLYTIAQSTITRQQTTIDSLRSIITAAENTIDGASEIAPEVKVLFPDIKDIGIANSVFVHTDDGNTDTMFVALVKTDSKMHNSEREKLARYIEARLKINKVDIITLP